MIWPESAISTASHQGVGSTTMSSVASSFSAVCGLAPVASRICTPLVCEEGFGESRARCVSVAATWPVSSRSSRRRRPADRFHAGPSRRRAAPATFFPPHACIGAPIAAGPPRRSRDMHPFGIVEQIKRIEHRAALRHAALGAQLDPGRLHQHAEESAVHGRKPSLLKAGARSRSGPKPALRRNPRRRDRKGDDLAAGGVHQKCRRQAHQLAALPQIEENIALGSA